MSEITQFPDLDTIERTSRGPLTLIEVNEDFGGGEPHITYLADKLLNTVYAKYEDASGSHMFQVMNPVDGKPMYATQLLKAYAADHI